MKGYEIAFFTHEGRRHGTTQMAEWLLLTARNLGLLVQPSWLAAKATDINATSTLRTFSS